MSRSYKRKMHRGGWLEDSMIKALDAVKNGMPNNSGSPTTTSKILAKGNNTVVNGAIK